MPSRNRYALAFTLIEILVVIAIAAVLLALIVPATKGVIERAKAVKCTSNLRQIGVAYLSITADNNNYLLPTYKVLRPGGPNEGSWQHLLQTASDWNGSFSVNPLFHCPMDPLVPGHPDYSDFFSSYGQNVVLCPSAPKGPNLATIPEQSKTFLIMDVVKGLGAHPRFGGYYDPKARHGTNCNVLFVDGHVEALSPTSIKDAPYSWPNTPPYTTTNSYRWR